MEPTTNFMLPQDLTGQVSILDIVPKFTGNYSSVFLGALNGNFVAIKVIKATGRDESVNRKVIREVTLWAAANHRNIHPFYGVIYDHWCGPFGAFVSPWCLNGDANQYLSQNGGRMVTAERVNLWGGVIEGVAYLHQQIPVIVHGDLKPGNILIDDRGVPRICDFGLARILHDGESMGMTTTSEHTGAERYLAPELVISEEDVQPTTASDVYALGCLGLEFIYGQKPYAHRANNLRGRIIVDIRRQLPPATHPPHRSWVIDHFWTLIQQLWNIDPRYRPSSFNAALSLRFTTRNLPLTVIQRIAILLAVDYKWKCGAEEWLERTRALHALSLVSRSLYTFATPLLYQDIRLVREVAMSVLSGLVSALSRSVEMIRTSNHFPESYGGYTRTFLVCIGMDLVGLAEELPNALNQMPALQTLVIRSRTSIFRNIPVHPLKTVILEGDITRSMLRDRRLLSVFQQFQRLIAHEDFAQDYPIHRALPSRTYAMPNLQDIRLRGRFEPKHLVQELADWVTPRLTFLSCHIDQLELSPTGGFMELLRTKGPLLWYLKMEVVANVDPPTLDILSLCTNLHSFVFITPEYNRMSSLPPHLRLETLEVCVARVSPGEIFYLKDFDEFTSSWQLQYPNLLMATFKWRTRDLVASSDLEMTLHTKDDFYTLTSGEETHKRWNGYWQGAGPQGALGAMLESDTSNFGLSQLSNRWDLRGTAMLDSEMATSTPIWAMEQQQNAIERVRQWYGTEDRLVRLKAPTVGRSHRVQLVALNFELPETFIMSGNSTLCQIGFQLYRSCATRLPVALEQISGPLPQWRIPDIDSKVPQGVQKIYVADVSEPFTIALVRDVEEDFPLLLEISSFNPTTTTLGGLIGARLDGRARDCASIRLLSSLRDIQGLPCEMVMKEIQEVYSTMIFVLVTDEPLAYKFHNTYDGEVPPPLRLAFLQCRRLVESAPRLKAFVFQAVDFARALLHLSICIAEAVAEERIEGANQAYLISRIKSMVNKLRGIFTDIENSTDTSSLAITEILHLFFHELCQEQPGVVAVRQSLDALQARIALDPQNQGKLLEVPVMSLKIQEGDMYRRNSMHLLASRFGEPSGAGGSPSSDSLSGSDHEDRMSS